MKNQNSLSTGLFTSSFASTLQDREETIRGYACNNNCRLCPFPGLKCTFPKPSDTLHAMPFKEH